MQALIGSIRRMKRATMDNRLYGFIDALYALIDKAIMEKFQPSSK